MIEAVDSLWNQTNEELAMQCQWCKCYGHRKEWCTYLRRYMLCRGREHINEDCCQPHAHCSAEVECNVPLSHQHHDRITCPSTICLNEEL